MVLKNHDNLGKTPLQYISTVLTGHRNHILDTLCVCVFVNVCTG